MNEKHATIYNEGWRDGERAATERCYSTARAAFRLHSAAALVLVVLAAVATVERTATTYAAPAPVATPVPSSWWTGAPFRIRDGTSATITLSPTEGDVWYSDGKVWIRHNGRTSEIH